MAINNGQGITSYRRTMSERKGLPGAPARLPLPLTYVMVNPKRQQVSTIAVGGTATDGTYSITVTEPDGTTHVIAATRTGGAPATNADIAAALRAAGAALASLRGVATVGGATTAVVITFDNAGTEYGIATAAPAPGTLTATETTSSGGADLPMGRFVVRGDALPDDQRVAALPSGTSTAADVVGISMRDMTIPNAQSVLASAVEAFPPGSCLDVAYDGILWMKNVGGDAMQGGLAYVVISTAGGNELGEARGDADGGNTVAMEGARFARWDEDVPSGQVGPLLVRL